MPSYENSELWFSTFSFFIDFGDLRFGERAAFAAVFGLSKHWRYGG